MKLQVVGKTSEPGFAGMICKRINNKFVIYGGTYFPDNQPLTTDKFFSKQIQVFDTQWNLLYQQEGKISPDKGICIEGESALYYVLGNQLFRLEILDDGVLEELLIVLPEAFESGFGALHHDQLYFGQSNLYCYNLLTKQCVCKATFPVAPRAQGVFAQDEDYLYYLGGANDKSHLDVYRYSFEQDIWEPIANPLPQSVTGAAFYQINSQEVLIAGGFNKEIYDDAIQKLKNPNYKSVYFTLSREYFKWHKDLWLYNLKTHTYRKLISSELLAVCGAGLLVDGTSVYLYSGEFKPGIRTNKIIKIEEVLSEVIDELR